MGGHSKVGFVQDKIKVDDVDRSVTLVNVWDFQEFSKGKQVGVT
jgi:hypothetical protein